MKEVVALAKARDESVFGAKAIGLGDALRARLPAPPGLALASTIVEAVAAGDDGALKKITREARALRGPFAVRSSCVDEDSAQASFAGQHLTVLNVPDIDGLDDAIREIWWSANSDSAITYRQRVGLVNRPRVGVVVQSLLTPDAAGVLFTKNPVTGADERVIEASWGLGEAVVAGRVIPDTFRIARSGEVLERTPGVKKIAIRATPDGGTVEEEVATDLVEALCLDDAQLGQLHALATQCEQVYGVGRDIEFAFAGGELYLLQCRAVTRAASVGPAATEAPTVPSPISALENVPLFSELNGRELEKVARLFKERRFAAGETVAKEGAGAAAFYVIGSGDATVSVRGKQVAKLSAGDYFGEIALIDEGDRSATITAETELVCYGLTSWDFRPLVQQNASISWKLLQTLARRLRTAQES